MPMTKTRLRLLGYDPALWSAEYLSALSEHWGWRILDPSETTTETTEMFLDGYNKRWVNIKEYGDIHVVGKPARGRGQNVRREICCAGQMTNMCPFCCSVEHNPPEGYTWVRAGCEIKPGDLVAYIFSRSGDLLRGWETNDAFEMWVRGDWKYKISWQDDFRIIRPCL